MIEAGQSTRSRVIRPCHEQGDIIGIALVHYGNDHTQSQRACENNSQPYTPKAQLSIQPRSAPQQSVVD
ncbi:hypothetical protein D3C77_671430 [compost metagenome]